ncbi:aminotransferase class III-fold pyridoxal phosphate-dependent enzyme [Erythrobacter sp.]|uniref:aminotransferase family protein n=1 Tax=Erythrobacter sp. TaxID=1042 RepID=UPI001B0FCA6C|nr:aminotransferase class III-fold pyridoxal phosphate-dependent enzyme [Erythrobacter sp.]MBO6527555.1 aminotransferase class III-fold pyridoxal phosphate-dependent enzyme [Erythrobacter sp.]MBO6530235.1 aminotransferase class III-fold pyridoxal phosphate-dependent enzyme [Erythrobacter sp.]
MGSFAHLESIDRRHHFHPKTDNRAFRETGGPMMVRAEGCYVFDTTGKRYLDAVAGLANVNLGYSDRHVKDAIARQLETLPYWHSFTGTSNDASAALTRKLLDVLPTHLNNLYYIASGSEAIESGVKIAHLFWKRLGKPHKKKLITYDRSYHGNTVLASALTGNSIYHDQFHLPLADIIRLRSPYKFAHGRGETDADFTAQLIEELRAAIESHGPDTIAAIVAEPLQASGGGIVAPDGYWPEVAQLCRDYEVLFIADEVITGLGRLGHWLGSEAFGLEPDIVALAKGITSGYIPLGAVAFSDRVCDPLVASNEYFMHGFSASGHPVAAAAATATIEAIEKQDLLANVISGAGAVLRDALEALQSYEVVAEVRGRGLAVALELEPAVLGKSDPVINAHAAAVCAEICRRLGVLVRGADNTILLSPPLVIDHTEALAIASAIEFALKALPNT